MLLQYDRESILIKILQIFYLSITEMNFVIDQILMLLGISKGTEIGRIENVCKLIDIIIVDHYL